MSRSARLLLIAAAWALPVAWVLVALSAGPSDGSVVWSSPLTSDERWGARLVVLETYGDTALEVGDEIETIGGVSVTDLLAGERTDDLAVGDQVSYGVRRAGEGLARDQEVTVTLVRYAAPEALRENVPVVVVALLTVLAGSVAFWLQPLAIATRAFLGASSLLPTALTSAPWGLGAVDVAGARGLWPHAVGEIACTLGVGLALLAACTLRAPRGWLRARPWVAPVAILAPFAGYAVWVGVTLARTDAGPAQTQALLSILAPSLVVAVPLAAAALALTISHARSREVRLAARLALLALVAGVAVRLLLVELPDRVGDGPILPWDVLLLLVAPPLLAGIVVALVGYRLEDVEPVVRRTVVQGAVAALVGTAFVVVASAVGRATDVPVGAILTGGVVALAVLPVGVALQRGFRRLVYGDHDLRRTVVAELRRLDATTAPSEALTETLTLLSRRLRLAYAGIETDRDEEPLLASVGEAPRPTPRDRGAGGRRHPPRVAAPRGGAGPRPVPARRPAACSRTSAARSAPWSRPCSPNRELQALPAGDSSPPARRSADGCGATSTTASAPRWPPWPCAWSRAEDLIASRPGAGRRGRRGRSPTWRATRSPRYADSSTACARPRSTSSAWSPPCGSGPPSTT